MPTLIKGQKVDLTKVNPSLSTIKMGLGWDLKKAIRSFDLDAVALLVDEAGKLSSLKDVVFYNNLQESSASVRLSGDNRTGEGAGDDEEILIDLKKIPSHVRKIVIAAVIYEGNAKKQHFGKVENSYVRIIDGKNNKEMYRYDLEHNFEGTATVILGEVYLHNTEWKFAAIGTGIENGMDGLLSLYHLKANPTDLLKAASPKNIEVQKSAPSVGESPKPINLSKIELKKSGDKINLAKSDQPLGEILINLNWSQGNEGEKKKMLSSLFAAARKADLDLGCFYEMYDGSRGVVQALGNSFGSLKGFPYIHLDQDDRTGAVKGGENLRINGNRISDFKRILVFAFIYEGVANWSQIDGVVTLKQMNGPDIEVKLDDHHNGKGMCAIALIENTGKQEVSVKKIAKYYNGHAAMDKAFKWGMRWTAGSK